MSLRDIRLEFEWFNLYPFNEQEIIYLRCNLDKIVTDLVPNFEIITFADVTQESNLCLIELNVSTYVTNPTKEMEYIDKSLQEQLSFDNLKQYMEKQCIKSTT